MVVRDGSDDPGDPRRAAGHALRPAAQPRGHGTEDSPGFLRPNPAGVRLEGEAVG